MPKQKHHRTIHLTLMAFWASNLIAIWFLPPSWRIPYLAFCAIYSNLVGHWSSYASEK